MVFVILEGHAFTSSCHLTFFWSFYKVICYAFDILYPFVILDGVSLLFWGLKSSFHPTKSIPIIPFHIFNGPSLQASLCYMVSFYLVAPIWIVIWQVLVISNGHILRFSCISHAVWHDLWFMVYPHLIGFCNMTSLIFALSPILLPLYMFPRPGLWCTYLYLKGVECTFISSYLTMWNLCLLWYYMLVPSSKVERLCLRCTYRMWPCTWFTLQFLVISKGCHLNYLMVVFFGMPLHLRFHLTMSYPSILLF